jgi:hypothetical protein
VQNQPILSTNAFFAKDNLRRMEYIPMWFILGQVATIFKRNFYFEQILLSRDEIFSDFEAIINIFVDISLKIYFLVS